MLGQNEPNVADDDNDDNDDNEEEGEGEQEDENDVMMMSYHGIMVVNTLLLDDHQLTSLAVAGGEDIACRSAPCPWQRARLMKCRPYSCPADGRDPLDMDSCRFEKSQ